MEAYSHSPDRGGGAAAPAPGSSPTEAKKVFEFFKQGARREVLLLGDATQQQVHRLGTKGHNGLCTAAAGWCECCEAAATDPTISTRRDEFLFPAFVRGFRERQSLQRVAVLPEGGYEDLLKKLRGEPARGSLWEVCRGASNRLAIKPLGTLLPGPLDVLPPAFDLLPWVRARFGKRQDPARPLVVLPPFAFDAGDWPVGRARPLDLTPEDTGMSPEVREKIRGYRLKLAGGTAAVEPPATIPIGSAVPEVLDTEVKGEGPARVPLAGFPADAYGPKQVAREAVPADATGTPAPKLLADKAVESLARRRAEKQQAAADAAKGINPEAVEAVELGRIPEYVRGRAAGRPIPAHLNGAAATGKKGGAK